VKEMAEKLLHKGVEDLTAGEQKVLQYMADSTHISRNINTEFHESLTLGQRVADRVASFGGSWPFIIIFAVVLLAWIVLNSVILMKIGQTFDPYPYILLNLFLSMLAAIQAPVIMMSQNRQAAKDRLDATHDYEVNLKAELEILNLHQKLDDLREKKWAALAAQQAEQIRLLSHIVDTLEKR
jgi:uncharacterized membrane protein